jgi:hypothetical protein
VELGWELRTHVVISGNAMASRLQTPSLPAAPLVSLELGGSLRELRKKLNCGRSISKGQPTPQLIQEGGMPRERAGISPLGRNVGNPSQNLCCVRTSWRTWGQRSKDNRRSKIINRQIESRGNQEETSKDFGGTLAGALILCEPAGKRWAN